MTPAELFTHLGEADFKEKFLSLNAETMKKLMAEARLSTARLPSHTSTRRRNEDWAKKLWNFNDLNKVATGLLYVWLSYCRRDLLANFLDRIGVAHQHGLTDDDFLSQVDEKLLLAAASELLKSDTFSAKDVATYLLFLDFTSNSQKFESLELAKYLSTST